MEETGRRRRCRACCRSSGSRRCPGCRCRLPPLPLLRPPRLPPQAAPALSPLRLRCPATFLDVKAAVGASVKAGDVLCILEAMKMENEIVAPQDGTVASVNVPQGRRRERAAICSFP